MTEDLYSVILPTYNEAQNLPLIIYLLQKMSEQYAIPLQIIIIEDSSPDGTLAVAQKLNKLYANINIVSRSSKMGLGSAYREGLKHVKGNFVIIMDADLSHHPKYIPSMVIKQKQNNADIVTGTRYIENAGVQGWTFMRKLTSRVANFIASWALGTNFSDLTGSFRLYKKEVLQQLMPNITTKGYSFQMEILFRAWKQDKIIIEQPIVFVDRIYGKSKLGPNEVYLYLKGVGKLFIQY